MSTDSFFDMPAGYRDADLEMASLEAAGNRWAKLIRLYGEDKARKLRDGETIEAPCRSKSTGETYTVFVCMDSGWNRDYSLTGSAPWFGSAAEAFAGQAV